MKPTIGEYRLIQAGTYFWSIDLQAQIASKEDEVVRITNTIYSDDKHFFGELQLVLFKFMIPSYLDKTNGCISMSIKDTKPYTKLKPNKGFLKGL